MQLSTSELQAIFRNNVRLAHRLSAARDIKEAESSGEVIDIDLASIFGKILDDTKQIESGDN